MSCLHNTLALSRFHHHCAPIQHHAGDQPDLMINGDNNLEEIFKWAPTGPGNTHAVFLNNKQCSIFLFEILI
jgi:hypothetical protein